EREALDLAPPEGRPAAPAEAGLALLLGLEERAEDARQVADILGDEEVVLHEALDAARPGMVGIAHAAADLALDVEGEALLGAAREVVEVAAHGPQEVLRPREARRLVGREDAELDELADLVDAVDVLGDPEEALEVAEPALALLDVGLDMVARIAELSMPRVALGELRLDELAGALLDDLGLEAALHLVKDLRVAPDVARLEQRRADRHVGARLAQAVLDPPRRLADLEAEIPQHVEHVLDDLLGVRRQLVRQQEEQVDIRARRQLAAAVAADGDDGEALARRRVGQGIGMAHREIVQRPDQLIHQEAMLAHGLRRGAPRREAAADLRRPGGESRLQPLDDRRAPAIGGGAGGRGKTGQRLAERAAVDDVALPRNGAHRPLIHQSRAADHPPARQARRRSCARSARARASSTAAAGTSSSGALRQPQRAAM